MLSLTLYQLVACASGRPFKRSVLQLTIRLRARGLYEAIVVRAKTEIQIRIKHKISPKCASKRIIWPLAVYRGEDSVWSSQSNLQHLQ